MFRKCKKYARQKILNLIELRLKTYADEIDQKIERESEASKKREEEHKTEIRQCRKKSIDFMPCRYQMRLDIIILTSCTNQRSAGTLQTDEATHRTCILNSWERHLKQRLRKRSQLERTVVWSLYAVDGDSLENTKQSEQKLIRYFCC